MPPVIIKHETHQRIAAYAKATGKSISSSADEAINEWMTTNGEPIMKFIERQKKKPAGRLLASMPNRNSNDFRDKLSQAYD
jgi:hypothetical protein